MKKLLIDESLCNACGMCILGCELLTETNEGKAKVIPPGIVEESSLENALSAINICPVSAIRLEENVSDLTLDDFKRKLAEPLNFIMPDKTAYAYDASAFEGKLPMMSTSNEYKYQYKTFKKAEEAGLKEFCDQIYSQKAAMAQQIVISYKHDKVYKFMKYEEMDGNYKYEIHKNLIEKLKSYVKEFEILTGRSLDLPNDFFTFKTRNSNTFKDIDKYALDQGLAGAIAAEVDPPSSYSCYIDSDDTEICVKKSGWFKSDDWDTEDRWCFKVGEAVKELHKDLLHEANYVLSEQMQSYIESELKFFFEQTQFEWNDKISYLLKNIE